MRRWLASKPSVNSRRLPDSPLPSRRCERPRCRRFRRNVGFVTLAPSGTVTFLFTDLEGSTRLWEERPDEMQSSLAEHDERVKAAIAAHGGYVFSPGGDGFGA